MALCKTHAVVVLTLVHSFLVSANSENAAAAGRPHHVEDHASSDRVEEDKEDFYSWTWAPTFSVPLAKQHVPVVINGREVAKKTAYSGTIFVGLPRPQEFTVVFDTGSGHLFLPSGECQLDACKMHRQFERRLSSSYQDINHDGTRVRYKNNVHDQISIAYGTGEIVGDFVREDICIARPAPPNSYRVGNIRTRHCARARVVLATEMTEEPFSYFGFDGVLGLSLGGLALDPEFHFFGQMTRDLMIKPVFSFFLSKHDEVSSEITFGGTNPNRLAEKMHWVPVSNPAAGYWKVAIKGVRIGNESLALCDDGECTAIVDTGTSLLGVPFIGLEDFITATNRDLPAGTPADIDCRAVTGPTVSFELESGYILTLESSEYTRPAPIEMEDEQPSEENDEEAAAGEANATAEAEVRAPGAADAASQATAASASEEERQRICRGSFLPVDMPTLGDKVFIWGEPVLQKYYTSYDSHLERVGFALSVQGDLSERSASEAAGGQQPQQQAPQSVVV
eukprot:TRINITY_DN281_c0_g1_i5.p1 TRINITY_DN281_c0_g1~~TRINITY_DN281_c0_g1_i5.p1  ORF type:complete len:591 (-),score=112.08 TRINITY_DN281_c0_g1_i5:123-1649(-)